MLNFLKKFIFPPKFEDERKDRAARYLSISLNLTFGILALLSFNGQFLFIVRFILAILAVATFASHLLLHAGKINLTIILFSLFIWAGLTYLAWVGEGIRDISIVAYLILIFLASFLGSPRLSIFLTALGILSIWALYYVQEIGLYTPTATTPLLNAFTFLASIFILFNAILYFTINDLENAFQGSLQKEKTLIKQNAELLALQEALKEKSAAEKKATEAASLQADRLQVITLIIQKITLTQDITQLLPDVVTLISEKFGFYHVGIFQPSIDKKYMQLKAANSEGGQRMIERNHQLAIGQTSSIIGKAAEDQKPIIAFEVNDNKDVSRFESPELAETRSQMALPLIFGGSLLGVLDIQSKETGAFSQADIEVFTTLANQIALVIENTRQFELSKNALAEMEEVSRQYLRQQWSRLRQRKAETGYRYLNGTMETLTSTELTVDNLPTTLQIPVKIRNQVIGLIQIRSDNKNKRWQEEDVELLQTVANRVALAIENARLLEDTTLQAGKENAISQFAATINEVSQTEKLMSVAVSELQKILEATEVSFELTDL